MRRNDALPPVRTTEDIGDTGDIYTEEDILDTDDVLDEDNMARPPRRRRRVGPPEDEEVNPVGSYETWDQSGQSLDAAGSGMTGDSGTIGLDGTGFEDDPDLD